ncbi:sensor histidine kinase [Cohnella sp.]|uniref:sensor histidine kinase n=1 Tax=Cohnella sp. TaxID=1883426 RepID=UPI0037048822
MGNITKQWAIPIYMKLILTFLAILTPLFGLSLAMNEYGSSSVRTEITRSMQSKVHFYNKSLENEFSRIIRIIKEFTSYEDLDYLSHRSEIMGVFEKRTRIQDVQKELIFIKSSSHLILSAEVHVTSIDRTISDGGYDSIPRDRFDALNIVTNIYESPFIHWEDRLFISLPFPITPNNLQPDFVVDVEIDKEKLRQDFLEFTDSASGNVVWTDQERDWEISAQESGSLGMAAQLSDEAGVRSIVGQGRNYLVAYEKSGVLGTTLMMYEDEKTLLGPLRLHRIGFWLLSGLSLLLIVGVSFTVYRLIRQPLKTLIRGFRKIEQGDLNVSFEYRGHDEFKYLYGQFNAMTRNLQQLIDEAFAQKYRAQNAELRQLQSQINPHFLYNSLFILNRLAKKSRDQTQIDFTKYLSDYFHFMTRNSSNEVTLAEEVRHARNYVEIQTIRFAGHIETRFDPLPDEWVSIRVPRLILQPIVENAYKYALEQHERGGKLRVAFEHIDGDAVIRVEDNGERIGPQDVHRLRQRLNDFNISQETTGLVNLHRRLVYRFGPHYGIGLSEGSEAGLSVSVRLPMNNEAIEKTEG